MKNPTSKFEIMFQVCRMPLMKEVNNGTGGSRSDQ